LSFGEYAPSLLQTKGGNDMAKPQYPTKEGIWAKGQRAEQTYPGVKLGLPYKEAVDSLRGALRDRDDFDPAVDKIIPHGTDRCHFSVDRWEDDAGTHPWDKYSEELARRALDKMKGTDKKRDN
jgi:hypothetical protein